MLARIRSVTAGTRSTISCSAWLSGSPLLTFSAVASGSVTAPMSASIAATSTSHASSQPVSIARSAISRLTRPARPKAAGLASASTSVSAWMLPRSVCSSSVRSALSTSCCQSAAEHARSRSSRPHGLVRKRKIWPSLTACAAASASAWPVSSMRTGARRHALGVAQELGARHAGHPHVGDDHGEAVPVGLQHRERRFAARGRRERRTTAQRVLQPFEDVWLVVHAEDSRQRLAARPGRLAVRRLVRRCACLSK